MLTLDNLIASKEEPHDMFGNGYQFVFLHIENLIVSKMNGAKRAAEFISHYDNEALALVYFQLNKMGEIQGIDLTTDLFEIIGKPEVSESAMNKIRKNIIVI